MEQKEVVYYPFEIKLDERIDLGSLTIRVEFAGNLPDEERFEGAVKKWAEKGIAEGYGGKKMHYLDDEPDESGEGGFDWNKDKKWVEFFTDLGDSNEETLKGLYQTLLDFNQVKLVRVGSGYEDW